ncbi:metallophosphoesterase [Flavobacterium algicola]|uniref:metallophosphoesterase n=1 Tax=Flavobacterium algicola TaxID=556529 RepID=UPI001EFE796A|nr:metallophosphoesterase [Flavobacterium algicola]MCG9791608.1 metallophosphoesterase [Flavobacterium algicola]
MKKIIYSFILLGVCQVVMAQQNKNAVENTSKLETIDKSLNFLLMGDFGRHGQFYQKEVAAQMGNAAKTIDSDFVISVGDNFYPNGVQSTQDYAWIASFESIYTAYSLQNDWFVTLGNHDYRGNPQAEIDYTKVSRRWQMPSAYFSKTFELKGGDKVLVLFMDTSPFIDSYYEKGNMMYDNLIAQDTTAQKKWLVKELAVNDKTVKWKIVVGHHPLYSGGKRKESPDTAAFEKKFATIFDTYKVDAYLCGHEHDLQVIQPKGRYTTQFLSGSACEVRPTGKREGTMFSAETAGFMTFSITNSSLLAQVVDAEGKVIYKTTIEKK